jgi:hypothetical protein
MRQNTTQPETHEALDARQEKALDSLLAGETATAASKAAGVHRSTVHRWLQRDFHFIAALNEMRQANRVASVARLEALSEKAIAVVERRLDGNDGRTALTLLRGLGLLDGAELPGSPDAEVLEAENAADVARRTSVSRRSLMTNYDPTEALRTMMGGR